MGALLLRRALLAIPTLAGVVVVAFLLLYVAPGDPVLEMVGERADSATIVRLRKELHLDESLPRQFAHYAGGVVRGDLGRSFITGRPKETRLALLEELNEQIVAGAGISPDDLMIQLTELPGENFSFGRGLAQRASVSQLKEKTS